MRLLLAEDDAGLRSVLARGLRENGYVVDAVEDGQKALRYAAAYEYAIAVIDWRMPATDGLTAISELRRRGATLPILMLTARDANADRVTGLDAGADDYLVKPFDFAELLARLRALQRRPAQTFEARLDVGGVVFDPVTRTVAYQGKDIELTGTELAILELMMRRSPAVVSRRTIAVQVWDDEADAVGSNTIDVHVGRLRSKLRDTGATISTIRGLGYRLSDG